ncbi:putative polysaccharide biosynthesis protein [Alkalihalobacterium bogoriense]|uniref:putative polysaccharide biosynthesis protein n=1 Tax=Alkalihalobacterium bogoriense TaxID=246272 RepID=UPI0005531D5B|nr:polysaccharide biosynthesis protein [Alkalihalobacterium bogoriense]
MNKGRFGSFWQGAVLLSVAALIAKVLSAVYRVPYQNIAGDIGFYVYQQVYPIYGIAFMLSMYGFPVIISKLISEQNHSDSSFQQKERIINVALYTLSTFFLVFSVCLYSGAPMIATVMGDNDLIVPLQVAAGAFLFVPILSVLRGYFQGNGQMLPTAVSHVSEQLVRVVLILVFAFYFMTSGSGEYAAGTGAVAGSVLGCLMSVIVLLFYFIKHETRSWSFKVELNETTWNLAKRIMKDGVFLSFSALILVFFQFIDSLTVLRVLQQSEVPIEIAKQAKGVYDRGQPLLQFGTIIATSMALSIVPALSQLAMERKKAKMYAELSLRLTFIIGMAATVGLFIIIEPTNQMLFTDTSDSNVLGVLGMTILFSSISLVTAAILQGYGHMKQVAIHMTVGMIIKLLLNLLLLVPFGTMGAAISTVMGFFVIAFLNVYSLVRQKEMMIPKKQHGMAIISAVLVMAIFTWGWKEILYFVIPLDESRGFSAIVAITSACIGAVVLCFCLLRWHAFTKDELSKIPKVEKVYKVVQGKKEEVT